MKLQKLSVHTFGKWKDFTLSTPEGLSVVYGENESGKTTLLDFLMMMLYGSSARKMDARENPRLRYGLKDGKEASGVLYFEAGGKEYRLECVFRNVNSRDRWVLRDASDGKEISLPANQTVGEFFFGVDQAAFARSAFIGPQGNVIAAEGKEKRDDLLDRLMNLVNTGDETFSYREVSKRLNQASKQLIGTEKNPGKIDQLERELQTLQEEWTAAEAAEAERMQVREELAAQEQAVQRLEQAQQRYYAERAQETLRERGEALRKKRAHREAWCEAKKRMQEVESSLQLPGLQIDAEQLQHFRTLLSQWNEAIRQEREGEEANERAAEELSKARAAVARYGVGAEDDIAQLAHAVAVAKESRQAAETEVEGLQRAAEEAVAQKETAQRACEEARTAEDAAREAEAAAARVVHEAEETHMPVSERVDRPNASWGRWPLAVGIAVGLLAVAGYGLQWLSLGQSGVGLLLAAALLGVGWLRGQTERKRQADEIRHNQAIQQQQQEVLRQAREVQAEKAEVRQRAYEARLAKEAEQEAARVRETERREALHQGERRRDRLRYEADQQVSKYEEAKKGLEASVERQERAQAQKAKQEQRIKEAKTTSERCAEEVKEAFERPLSPEELQTQLLSLEETLREWERERSRVQLLQAQGVEEGESLEAAWQAWQEEAKDLALDATGRSREAIDADIDASHEDILRLQQEMAKKQASLRLKYREQKNQSQLALERTALQAELADWREREQALTLAKEALEQAYDHAQKNFNPPLNARTSEIFRRLTEGRYDKVLVRRDYAMSVETAQEQFFDWTYLSSGAMEQLYFSLRLALSEMVSPEEPWPLFLDDAFVLFDDQRAERAFCFLQEYAKEQGRQILFFTCQGRLRRFAEAAKLPCTVLSNEL